MIAIQQSRAQRPRGGRHAGAAGRRDHADHRPAACWCARACAEIRELGRATQGVTLIALDDGTKLSGLQRIVENDANVENLDIVEGGTGPPDPFTRNRRHPRLRKLPNETLDRPGAAERHLRRARAVVPAKEGTGQPGAGCSNPASTHWPTPSPNALPCRPCRPLRRRCGRCRPIVVKRRARPSRPRSRSSSTGLCHPEGPRHQARAHHHRAGARRSSTKRS